MTENRLSCSLLLFCTTIVCVLSQTEESGSPGNPNLVFGDIECQRDGYTFLKDIDSPPLNEGTKIDDLTEAASACETAENCVAFNSLGYLMEELLPPDELQKLSSEGECQGIYVRDTGVPRPSSTWCC